jgi:hypothetical protein
MAVRASSRTHRPSPRERHLSSWVAPPQLPGQTARRATHPTHLPSPAHAPVPAARFRPQSTHRADKPSPGQPPPRPRRLRQSGSALFGEPLPSRQPLSGSDAKTHKKNCNYRFYRPQSHFYRRKWLSTGYAASFATSRRVQFSGREKMCSAITIGFSPVSDTLKCTIEHQCLRAHWMCGIISLNSEEVHYSELKTRLQRMIKKDTAAHFSTQN